MLGLAVILSLGCAGEPSAPTTGSIRVSASTLGDAIDIDPDGYTVSIDDGPNLTLGLGTELTLAHVGVGNHLIRLSAVGANCSVDGANPRSVEVTGARDAGTAVRVEFIVTCAPNTGTIQVTATTVGDAHNGNSYSVEVDGAAKGRVDENGTLNVEAVRVGARQVSLRDVSPNCRVDGPDPAATTVAFGQTALVGLTVRCLAAAAVGSLEVTTVTTGDDYPLGGYDVNVFPLTGAARDSRYARVPPNGTVTIPGLLAGPAQLWFAQVPQNCAMTPANRSVVDVRAGVLTPVIVGVACEGPRKIAYVRGSGEDADIYLIYSNGTGPNPQITNTGGANLDPAWSPDGSKIVFASSRDGNFEIYSMGASGQNPVRLTQNSAADSRPAWSPNGSRIAFVSNRDGNREIYVMNADGTNQVRLTSDAAADSDPDWSPDGTRIAFSSEREIGGIWIMSADGSDARRLTSNTSGDYQPAWSPDGSRIAFSHGVSATARDIYFVSVDGSSAVPFLSVLGNATDPSWSPDGHNLAFSSLQCWSDWYYDYCDTYLQIASADGTRVRAIPQSNASNPAYQP